MPVFLVVTERKIRHYYAVEAASVGQAKRLYGAQKITAKLGFTDETAGEPEIKGPHLSVGELIVSEQLDNLEQE